MMIKQSAWSAILLASSILTTSCALQPAQDVDTSPVVWPKPPAQPRIIYETTLRSQANLAEANGLDQFRRFATGEGQDEANPFVKPYDVAAQKGLVAVTDTKAGLVHVFDIPRRRMFAIGWRRTGKLAQPLGVAIDHQRQIYVADSAVGRIVVFDHQGHFLKFIGEPKQFSRLSDVVVSPLNGQIFALDRGGVDSQWHRIVVFDNQGGFVRYIGGRGHGQGDFNHPNQLAMGKDGILYVLDAGNFRVQSFDKKGEFLSAWGKPGKLMGDFARPRGIAVDRHGRVLVTDAAFQNFQIFNPQGQLLMALGEQTQKDIPGRYLLPSGIAVDETQRIYIVDQLLRKIEVLRFLEESESRLAPEN